MRRPWDKRAIFREPKTGTSKFIICAALVGLFLWPAIYNRQPLFSPDTSAYIRGFDAAIVWLCGRHSEWTTWAAEIKNPSAQANTSIDPSPSLQSQKFIIAGRSVSYGALLYLGELLGGMWITIGIQAAAALTALSLTLRHFDCFSWRRLVCCAGTVALLSSLPFCASFLLPDIFAGLSILAAANLLAHGERLNRWETLFWVSVLAAAVVFHPTHLAIALVILAVGLIVRLSTTRISVVGMFAIALSGAFGLASEASFDIAVESLLGTPVSRPPVLMARMIADGPGDAYLRENCPQVRLVACDFVNFLHTNSDAFLWNTSPNSGSYRSAAIEKRQSLGSEQYKFALGVALYDPFGMAKAALDDGLQQLTTAGLSEFVAGASNLPRIHAENMAQSAVGRGRFPDSIFTAITAFGSIVSLIFLAGIFVRRGGWVCAEEKIFCLVVLLGEISNAFICGAISGPHDRYQARLTWLLPLMALTLFYKVRSPSSFISNWLVSDTHSNASELDQLASNR